MTSTSTLLHNSNTHTTNNHSQNQDILVQSLLSYFVDTTSEMNKDDKKEHNDSSLAKPAKKKTTKKRKLAEGELEKPPSSSYSLFTAHTSKKLKERSPDLPFTEISRKVAELWKNPELKQEWERKHANLQIEYMWNLAKQREGTLVHSTEESKDE